MVSSIGDGSSALIGRLNCIGQWLSMALLYMIMSWRSIVAGLVNPLLEDRSIEKVKRAGLENQERKGIQL